MRIARDYAHRAGFQLDDGIAPIVTDEAPAFDRLVLHRVSLGLAVPSGTALGDGDRAALDVYLDDAGEIRVVEDGIPWRLAPVGASRSEALRAGARHLQLAGVDPGQGTVKVASGEEGRYWVLTFDRAIDGYRVANAPMGWWLTGDKAYLQLRGDGSLRELYVIRPDHANVPTILDTTTLAGRLATVAGVSRAKLAAFDLEFVWVRAQDRATGAEDTVLSLAYCATHRNDDGSGWWAWCVDAGTGAFTTTGGGVD